MKSLKVRSHSDIEQALTEARGNVSEAATALNVLFGELWDHVQSSSELLAIAEGQIQGIIEDCQMVISEAVDQEQRWAIQFVLKTVGKKRGWGKFQPQPMKVLPPDVVEPDPDESRLTPEELQRYHYFDARALGFEDGVRQPDPDWVKRLDEQIEEVRDAFTLFRYSPRHVAAKLDIKHSQLQEYLALRPDLYYAVGDPREELYSRAVRGLANAVRAKKPWAVMLALRTQARGLGFSENPYDEVRRQQPKAPHAYDFARLTSDELCEYDELGYKLRGIPLPRHKQLQKDLRERIARIDAAEKEKQKRA